MTSRAIRLALMVPLLLAATLIPGAAEDDTAGTTARTISKTPTKTAFQTYKWGRFRFEYDFAYGESLTDPPAQGTDTKGRWVDASNGSGRAAQYNGDLALTSRFGLRTRDGEIGDRGTTSATLRGAPKSLGRWELRIRPWEDETGGAPYRIRFELIPEKPGQRKCRASILGAEFSPTGKNVAMALTSPRTRHKWKKSARLYPIERTANAFAVEVTKKHVAWLINGKTVAFARKTADFPRVPLTIRVSLVGKPGKEMTKTNVLMDWIRSWPANQGSQVKKGPKMRLTTIKKPAGC